MNRFAVLSLFFLVPACSPGVSGPPLEVADAGLEVDAAVVDPVDDAGTVPEVDAGAPEVDAGTVVTDAGVDAGTLRDAGVRCPHGRSGVVISNPVDYQRVRQSPAGWFLPERGDWSCDPETGYHTWVWGYVFRQPSQLYVDGYEILYRDGYVLHPATTRMLRFEMVGS